MLAIAGLDPGQFRRCDGACVIVDLAIDVRLASECGERRRDRIAKEIVKRFGKAATLIETKVTDVMKELETRRAHGAQRHETATSRSPAPERNPELEALEGELAQKHWDAWIDSKMPALGNRTPRQAAKTVRGRERLAALLADFARTAERSPSATRPDVEALRRTLGLD